MGLGWGKLYVTIERRPCFFAVKIASQLFLRLAVKIVTAYFETLLIAALMVADLQSYFNMIRIYS